jgi:uncharacterized protein (UPF0332 family)
MAFDWGSFLKVAYYLYRLEEEDLSREARCRIAISRAYYAAFCCARNSAREKGRFIPFYDDRDHKAVCDYFFQGKYKGIASRLRELRDWRNKADYDDDVVELITHTEKILKAADEVIGYLK